MALREGVVTEMMILGDNSNCCNSEATHGMRICAPKNHTINTGYRNCLFSHLNLLQKAGMPSERNDLNRRD